MTQDEDDDREGFEPEAPPGDAGDPAAAFDALRQAIEDLAVNLRREMTTVRKGVELTLEEFDRHGPPADYKPQIALLTKQLGVVAEHLRGVEQSPVLKHGADHYGAILERSGESLVGTAAQQLERRSTDLERTANNLARHVTSARERRQQDHWLWGVGAAGLVAGVLLTLFLPRVLPGSVDMAVASTAMNADRWTAGSALMQSGDPEGYRAVVKASNLVRANTDALTACAEAAAKAKKDQICTITVPASVQQ